MKTASITVTLHENDYAELQQEEGWKGTTEQFVKNMELRVKHNLQGKVSEFTYTVRHGATAGVAVKIPRGTTTDVVRAMENVLRKLKEMGILTC